MIVQARFVENLKEYLEKKELGVTIEKKFFYDTFLFDINYVTWAHPGEKGSGEIWEKLKIRFGAN